MKKELEKALEEVYQHESMIEPKTNCKGYDIIKKALKTYSLIINYAPAKFVEAYIEAQRNKLKHEYYMNKHNKGVIR